jgi:uncharacterized protein (TIGR00255 family)
MLYSMTGFGRAESSVNDRQVVVEIRSLNGKLFDMSAKLPPVLKAYELDIRSMLNGTLIRGTLDITVSIRQEGASRPMTVNTALARYYYQSMRQIAQELAIPEEQVLATLMRMPEVVAADQDVISEEEWIHVKAVIEAAAGHLTEHRRNEGASLEYDLTLRITNIERLLEQIQPLEAQRTERVRTRIRQSLEEMIGADKIDPNRLEQEMIYYIERMDFSEEKTRLTQHCSYFREILNRNDNAKGKMLGFTLQEIGREINTLGAKANDAGIQQLVIQMKDELEKSKEQVLNVL